MRRSKSGIDKGACTVQSINADAAISFLSQFSVGNIFFYIIYAFVIPCLQDFDMAETHDLVLTTVLRKSFNWYECIYTDTNRNRGFEVKVEKKIYIHQFKFFMEILLACISLSMTTGAARPEWT